MGQKRQLQTSSIHVILRSLVVMCNANANIESLICCIKSLICHMLTVMRPLAARALTDAKSSLSYGKINSIANKRCLQYMAMQWVRLCPKPSTHFRSRHGTISVISQCLISWPKSPRQNQCCCKWMGDSNDSLSCTRLVTARLPTEAALASRLPDSSDVAS